MVPDAGVDGGAGVGGDILLLEAHLGELCATTQSSAQFSIVSLYFLVGYRTLPIRRPLPAPAQLI